MEDQAEPAARLARAADLRGLAEIEDAGGALYAELLGEDGMVEALRLPAPTGQHRQAVPGFLLVVGSPPVGFAHVVVLDGYAHLEQISVLPAHQRRGRGSVLVRAAMHEARAQGFETLSLCTYRDVAWNAPFYAGLGFAEVTDLLAYQRRLREVERDLGLDGAGTRVVMSVRLSPGGDPDPLEVTGQ